MLKSIILIPSRLAATRLPNKPLLKIKGKSLISLVYKNAANSKAGDVYVVTGDKKILSNVQKEGGKAILTKKKHKTGTDRIFEATQRLKNLRYDYVLNLQGDEPNIDIKDIKKLVKLTNNNIEHLAMAIAEYDLFPSDIPFPNLVDDIQEKLDVILKNFHKKNHEAVVYSTGS